MNNTIRQIQLEEFPYFRATSLRERAIHVQRNGKGSNVPEKREEKLLLEQTVTEWKAQFPFAEEDVFAQRLAVDGINEQDLPYIMADPDHHLAAVDEQAWVQEFKNVRTFFSLEKEPIRFPAAVTDNWPEVRFLEVLQPFLQYACSSLITGIAELRQKYAVIPFTQEDIIKTFLMNVPTQLVWAVSRTLVLELHIARLEGVLHKNKPEERFEEFLQHMQQPANLYALLNEYPVLTRLISTLFAQWRESVLEFLAHLCQDWEKLQSTFGLDPQHDTLKEIRIGAGDRHRNGRSVIIARFSSEIRLVYKPRSLAVEQQFQRLLAWFNTHNQLAPFRLLTVVDCGSHGWVEFVDARPCTSPEEIKRFYIRQGSYLALLYALGSNDFHYENVIADGEHPVLVDMETLFSPVPPEDLIDELPTDRFIAHSVMAVGLLPNRIWTEGESEGVDVSGLGMKDGQLSPSPLPGWEQVNTDEMHVSRARRLLSGHTHRPRYGNGQINALDYKQEIIDGFTAMYKLLLTVKNQLLDEDGPLAKMANSEIRVILRPTRIYSMLQQEGLHPDLMQDALEMDRHFDRLWAGTYRSRILRSVIGYEQADLWRFDVPVFTTLSSSTDLQTSTHIKLKDFFSLSGLEQAKNKLRQLSPDDMIQQSWLINTALATLADASNKERMGVQSAPAQPRLQAGQNKERLLTESIKIGDYLQQLAIEDNEYASWLGIQYVEAGNHWAIAPLDASLYSGLSGIGLFLAYLGHITHNDHYTSLAQKTVNSVNYLLDHENSTLNDIGAFEGLGSVIYVLTHLGVLWHDEQLLDKAVTLADSLHEKISGDEKFDIMSGSAGCIAALITLHKITRRPGILKTAELCGDHLIKNALPVKNSVAWLQRGVNIIDQPLTGFSHGVAGIAWALNQLAEVTENRQYAAVAQKSLTYERALFSPANGNWPDLRNYATFDSSSPEPSVYLNFWCHGAAGIGLARLSMMQHLSSDDNLLSKEVTAAYQTILAQGLGNGHCLCHGDLGSLEFLNEANSLLGMGNDDHLEQLVRQTLDSIEGHGWLCGNGLRVEEPGLMTGLAGIGYGLLRLLEPEQVPSVLLLQPPPL